MFELWLRKFCRESDKSSSCTSAYPILWLRGTVLSFWLSLYFLIMSTAALGHTLNGLNMNFIIDADYSIVSKIINDRETKNCTVRTQKCREQRHRTRLELPSRAKSVWGRTADSWDKLSELDLVETLTQFQPLESELRSLLGLATVPGSKPLNIQWHDHWHALRGSSGHHQQNL